MKYTIIAVITSTNKNENVAYNVYTCTECLPNSTEMNKQDSASHALEQNTCKLLKWCRKMALMYWEEYVVENILRYT